MSNYRIKYNPATGLAFETKQYTLWRLEEFLGPEYDEDKWEYKLDKRYDRRRAVILYSLRECSRNPQTNRNDQLEQTCRKYWRNQPVFWPRFLREKYPRGRIKDFFSISYDDLREEFYQYEQLARECDLDPRETNEVFDVVGVIRQFKEHIARVAESMDMNKAMKNKPKPIVLWPDDPPMTSNPEFLASHIKWLEARGVKPAVITKELPTGAHENR